MSSSGIAGGGVAAGRSAAGAPRRRARAHPQGDPAAHSPGPVRHVLSHDSQPLCCHICSHGTYAPLCLSRGLEKYRADQMFAASPSLDRRVA